MIWTGIGFLGLGLTSAPVHTWLFSDPTHFGILAVSLLFLLVTFAAYDQEKKNDELVHFTIANPEAVVRATLKSRNDVICTGFEVIIRNESDSPKKPLFPAIELLAKGARGKWEVIPVEHIEIVGRCGREAMGEFLNQHDRLEVRAFDDEFVNIWTKGTTSRGASSVVGRDLKMRLSFDFIGHPTICSEAELPRIAAAT